MPDTSLDEAISPEVKGVDKNSTSLTGPGTISDDAGLAKCFFQDVPGIIEP